MKDVLYLNWGWAGGGGGADVRGQGQNGRCFYDG